MKVRFKKLRDDAILPSYAKPGDAGMDLTAVEIYDPPGEFYIEYRTGLAVEIPEGYVGLLFPRSSVSKLDLVLANSVGVIDSGYRGEISFRYKYIEDDIKKDLYDIHSHGARRTSYEPGDRVGQLVIIPYPTIEPELTDELSSTERGDDGFGSSGI